MATKEQLKDLNQKLLEKQMSAQLEDKKVSTSELDAIADEVLPIGSPVACESSIQTYISQVTDDSKEGIYVPYIARPYTAGIFGGVLQIPKVTNDDYFGEVERSDYYYLVYTTHSRDSGFVSPISRSVLHDVEADTEDNTNCEGVKEYLFQDEIQLNELRELVIKLRDNKEAMTAQAYINSLVKPADLFSTVVARSMEVINPEDSANTLDFSGGILVTVSPQDTFEIITARHNSFELYLRSGISPSIFIPTIRIDGSTSPRV